jgi:hypothetical protein
LNCLGVKIVAKRGDHCKPKINPSRHPPAGYAITVEDDPLVNGTGAKNRQ